MKILDIPSFIRGAARVLDLGGTLSAYAWESPTDDEEAIRAALYGDWQDLGDDLRAVIAREVERPVVPLPEARVTARPRRIHGTA